MISSVYKNLTGMLIQYGNIVQHDQVADPQNFYIFSLQ